MPLFLFAFGRLRASRGCWAADGVAISIDSESFLDYYPGGRLCQLPKVWTPKTDQTVPILRVSCIIVQSDINHRLFAVAAPAVLCLCQNVH